MALPVERPTLAQVMISQLMSSSPASDSVLTARSLEPALDSVSPSLSAPNPLAFCLRVSHKINELKKKRNQSLKTMLINVWESEHCLKLFLGV